MEKRRNGEMRSDLGEENWEKRIGRRELGEEIWEKRFGRRDLGVDI
jgi:hypothetical protein